MIRTMPYPGFPTDAQAIVGAMLSVADGTSVIIEIYLRADLNT